MPALLDHSRPYVFYQSASRPVRTGGQVVDQVLFSLWVIVTFVQFRFDELILYPLALYYAYSVWRNQVQILHLLKRAWILLLFPVWCLISPIWAVEPFDAFKQAIYLTLTMLICFQVAIALTPRQIMHAVLIASGIIVVINFVYVFGFGRGIGVFQQKNQMGKNMVVAWIVALFSALDNRTPMPARLAALVVAGLAAVCAMSSGSATAVLLVLGTGAVGFFGYTMVRGGMLRASRLAVLFFMVAIAAWGLGTVVQTLDTSPKDAVLAAFGKDATLTGRTVLWHYAEQQIREEPLLGVGNGGFWRYFESPLVRRIYEEFYKGPYDHFNFHNSYYETAVHQGLIGLGIAIIASLWALWWILRGVFELATMPHIYFGCQTIAVLLRTTTEADFLHHFVIFHMLFWIGALVSLKVIRHEYVD